MSNALTKYYKEILQALMQNAQRGEIPDSGVDLGQGSFSALTALV